MIHNVILNKKTWSTQLRKSVSSPYFLNGELQICCNLCIIPHTNQKPYPMVKEILAPHLPGRKVKIFTSNTESASVYVSQKAS